MSKVVISRESIEKALSEHKVTSLTGLWKLLGGSGSVSGSASKLMRKAVPGIEKILAENKIVVPSKSERCQKGDGSTIQTSGKFKKPSKSPAKTDIPRHPKNPFRQGSGYGLLVDIIAAAGPKGIGKHDLQKEYSKYSGKDLTHTSYDMAVIHSASKDGDRRHRSCRDGFTIIKEGDNFRIRFD